MPKQLRKMKSELCL